MQFSYELVSPSRRGPPEFSEDRPSMVIGAQSLLLSHPLVPFPPAFSSPKNPGFLLFKRAAPLRREAAPVSCRAADFRTSSPSSPSPPEVEPEGRGAAAPTRGDKFLERQQAKSAAELVLKKEAKRRKKKPDGDAKLSTSVICCYGCGSPLQITEADAPGYVDPETYELVSPAAGVD